MKPRVIFATSVFENVDTGPGIYARYLWEAFRDDPDFDFHIVAPALREDHPHLHRVAKPFPAFRLYDAIAREALALVGDTRSAAILHGNATHSMARAVGCPAPWLVQVNDYESAEIWQRPAATLRRHGARRLAALAWRHGREKKVLRAATLSLCNSGYTRQRVLACYGNLDPNKLKVVVKAVRTDAFRRPASLPPDPFPQLPGRNRLLFVGLDWRRKGLAVLIEALPLIAAHIPDISLLMAGPASESDQAEIASRIRRIGATDRTTLLGQVDRAALARACWHCTALVLPSHAEALGVSILEGMAAGLPVVATRVGGIPEIIRSEAEGLLVPPGDAGQLAEAIVRLLTDETLRRQLAHAGPMRAQAFSVGAMVAEIKAIYGALLKL